jgi:hypothetical protein
VSNVFKLSGINPKRTLSRGARMLGPALSAMLLGVVLSGCKTDEILISATDRETQCAAWRRIMYSRKDTPLTAEQVQIHNATGRRLGCWK